MRQHMLLIRRLARREVEIGQRYRAFTILTLRMDHRVESDQGNRQIRSVGGDAVLAGAQDRMHPMGTRDSGAAGAAIALIACGDRGVAEIAAARALQQVSPDGCHIPQLG